MSDDFDWSGAPEGERWAWNSYRYVINKDQVHRSALHFAKGEWDTHSVFRATEIRAGGVRVADDLHPLVAGQQVIDWADELLRDPEAAGWTEAWIVAGPGRAVEVAFADGAHKSTTEVWRQSDFGPNWRGTHFILRDKDRYRCATATDTKEETVTETDDSRFDGAPEHVARVFMPNNGPVRVIDARGEVFAESEGTWLHLIQYETPEAAVNSYESRYGAHVEWVDPDEQGETVTTTATETLDEFKARVYKVGKAAAKEHGWCSVFDELMDELGIEPPKIEWPKPGTLFRARGVWGGDHLAVAIGDGLFRYVRYDDPDTLHDATAARHPFLGDFTNPSQLEILPV